MHAGSRSELGDVAVGPPSSEGTIEPFGRIAVRLDAASGRVAVVSAPAGYGKTTQVRAWAVRDPRHLAWTDVDRSDDDPRVLATTLLELLRPICHIRADELPPLSLGGDQFTTLVAPVFGRIVRRSSEPFVLVLDDIHLITSPAARDIVEALASNVPHGSAVILIGRSGPMIALSRLRDRGDVVDVTTDDLALDTDEARALLGAMDVALDDADLEQLVADVEGWPVGLRLAGAAVLHDAEPELDPRRDSSVRRDARVGAYLREEWLHGVSDADAEFLTQLSFLDWLSGPVCDFVLRRSDSGERLRLLHESTLLVIPLDRRGDRYRMHNLLRDALTSTAERTDRSGHRRRQLRASSWFERNGDIDRAVLHAIDADDLDRAERLVSEHAVPYHTTGRYSTVRRWLESFPQERLLTSPRLCVAAALTTLGDGQGASALTWVRFGQRALARPSPTTDPAARHEFTAFRAVVDTFDTDIDELIRAYEDLRPGHWHATACWAYGIREFLAGDDAHAASLFAEGGSEARVVGATTVEAQCLASRGVVLAATGDWVAARTAIRSARGLVATSGLEELPTLAVVTSASAMVEAIEGDGQRARADAALTRRHLPYIAGVSTWVNVQARIGLTEAYLLLGDRVAARTVLGEASTIVEAAPGAARLRGRLVDLAGQLRAGDGTLPYGPSSLTTAELRVLHYLPTNLTLAQIAQRLFVSRNTAKSHATAVYRKLGVSSRGEAVELASAVGLLSATLSPDPG